MTITATATVEMGLPSRVLISASSSPAVTDLVTVTRTHEDGSEHRVILEDNAKIIGTFVGYDYHAPFNQAVTYTVSAAGQTGTTSFVTIVSESTWLIHPSDPALSVMVSGDRLVGPVATRGRKTRAARYDVLGLKLPVHRAVAPRGGETGDLKILCTAEAEQLALEALLEDDWPILFNTPFSSTLFGWMWIAVGDLSIEFAGAGYRRDEVFVSFPFEETSRPDSDVTPVWTLDDLTAEAVTDYPTLDDLKVAGFADLDALKLRVL